MRPPDPRAPALRDADPADAAAIAALHTRSWRATYRGSLSDAYLDGPIEDERLGFWTQRLQSPPPGLVTLLAEGADGTPVGFVCALLDQDPDWGTLIDNLHVEPGAKRGGLGRLLMGAAAERLAALGSTRPVHLFVMQANLNARAFYARIGGEVVERTTHREPDASLVPVERIAWSSVAAFGAAVWRERA